MIRFSQPVFDSNNQMVGIIIVNYLAQQLIDNFKSIAKNAEGELYLLNANGYWLASPNPKQEWTFMYKEKSSINFKNEFPLEWKRIQSGEDSFLTEKGIFTHLIASPERNAATLFDPNTLVWGEGKLGIVSFINSTGSHSDILAIHPLDKAKKMIQSYWLNYVASFLIALLIASVIYIKSVTFAGMKYNSEYDGLTKVLNRRAGLALLDQLLQQEKRLRSKLSLCFLDVNGLKDVNDAFGHETGDELILTVVEVIQKAIRDSDYLIRLGGDEFLVVLPNAKEEDAESAWQRIITEFEAINSTEKRDYVISVSHGVAEFDQAKKTLVDELINRADEKMYQEKAEIKKQLVVIRNPK